MKIELIINGPTCDIYGIVIDGICIAYEFIESLDVISQKQIFTLFEHIRTSGPPHNKRKFRHLENDIYELKTNSGVRILCFFHNTPTRKRVIILTHGFFKPKERVLKREIAKAVNYLNEFFSNADVEEN